MQGQVQHRVPHVEVRQANEFRQLAAVARNDGGHTVKAFRACHAYCIEEAQARVAAVTYRHSVLSAARSMNVILWSAWMPLTAKKPSSTSSQAPRVNALTSSENCASHCDTLLRFAV